jgi:hypothetical protein
MSSSLCSYAPVITADDTTSAISAAATFMSAHTCVPGTCNGGATDISARRAKYHPTEAYWLFCVSCFMAASVRLPPRQDVNAPMTTQELLQ